MRLRIIYLDEVFFLNTALDALLLSATGKLSGAKGSGWRILLASVLGGAYACAVLLPNFGWMDTPLGLLIVLILMLMTGFRDRWMRTGGILLLLSCALGGIVLLLDRLMDSASYSGRVPISLQDTQLLLLSGGLLWAVAARLPRYISRGIETVPLLIEIGGKRQMLQALEDSGNGLIDPLTGKPVLVVDWHTIAHCLPTHVTQAACQNPTAQFAALSKEWPEGRLRLLPCKTVRSEYGMLLTFTADRVWVHGQMRRSVPVALSPVSLSDGRYQALIGIS